MKTYTSQDGIQIKVGESAKENDDLTLSSYPNEWWLHVDGGAGAHVVVCHEGDTLPAEQRETPHSSPYITVNPECKDGPRQSRENQSSHQR